MPAPVSDSVAILLCTYQGEAFLPQQLESIARQKYSQWTLWAADDGSRDRTLAILEDHKNHWGADRLFISEGPRQGYAANFLTLLYRDEIDAEYYAYCDQDDVWEPDKLAHALEYLRTIPAEIPALYGSRTQLIDECGVSLGESSPFKKPPGFANALVQSIYGGNTMVFNRAARTLLKNAGIVDVVAHDWWTYLLISGSGGAVFYDTWPSVRYRQHITNQMGANRRFTAQLVRAHMLLGGDFKVWNLRNLAALRAARAFLIPDHQKTLDAFAAIHSNGPWSRLAAFKRSGVYRQTALGNAGLWAAALLNRL